MEERVHWWGEGQVIGGEGTLVERRTSNLWREGQVIGGEGTLVGRRTSNWRRGYIGGEKDK